MLLTYYGTYDNKAFQESSKLSFVFLSLFGVEEFNSYTTIISSHYIGLQKIKPFKNCVTNIKYKS